MTSRAILFCLLALFATPAAAAELALGMMDASAYESIPARFAVRVQPMANQELERDLIAVFEDTFDEAGYDRVAQGGYLFSFRISGALERSRPQSRLQLEGQGGSQDSEDVSVRLRWKTGKKPDGKEQRDQILLARLQDPKGHVVWEARVVFVGGGEPSLETVSAVVPGIVGELGQEVIGKQLP